MKGKANLILSSVLTVISVLCTLAFCGYRIGFVFVDHEIHFNGFCYLLWGIFIANTVCLIFQLRSVLESNKYFNKPVFIVNGIVSALTLAATIGFAAYKPAEIPNFAQVSLELLPYLSAFYALIFLIFVFPYFGKIFKAIASAAVCIGILSSALIFLFPIGGFEIESAPAVFDTGSGYSVVFSTNRKSVGYITYEYDGKKYMVWDTTTGRKDASKVHSVRIPYEHLDHNKYSVRAVRAWEDIAYGGWLGAEISMDIDEFLPCPDDNFDMVCVSDNHSVKADWNKLAGCGDIYAFMGDIANGIYSYNAFTDNLIIPAGIMTGGKAPVIFVRGNHDHRGNYVPELLDALGFDDYYFRIEQGDYTFTVFDSGEDKTDDNYEYAGYADYSSYRDVQIEWARGLEKKSGYNIVMAHASDIFDETEEDIKAVTDILKDKGCDFIICGHSHRPRYAAPGESETGIQYYVCGSRDGKNDLRYTVMSFNGGHVSSVSRVLSTSDVLCEAEIALKETE